MGGSRDAFSVWNNQWLMQTLMTLLDEDSTFKLETMGSCSLFSTNLQRGKKESHDPLLANRLTFIIGCIGDIPIPKWAMK
jgi:hypothetical protein